MFLATHVYASETGVTEAFLRGCILDSMVFYCSQQKRKKNIQCVYTRGGPEVKNCKGTF